MSIAHTGAKPIVGGSHFIFWQDILLYFVLIWSIQSATETAVTIILHLVQNT